MTEKPNEFKLESNWEFPISNVVFTPFSAKHLLVSSWDSSLRLFDVEIDQLRQQFFCPGPLLDCCFMDATTAYCGGVDKSLRSFDLSIGQERVLGCHEGAIKCVEYCQDPAVVVTGSFDKTIRLWDVRSPAPPSSFHQAFKVYTMSLCGDKLIVGTEQRHVLIWDLRNMGFVLQRRESSLKFQTRCIKAFADHKGYVLGSIEGRVAVEYIDASPEVQKKKYAFKCHRIKAENGCEQIYPVNAISFHKRYSTFATGGSDGYVNIWDGDNKKRLCQFHQYPTTVSTIAFSDDGNSIAIGCSYLNECGEKNPVPERAVYIRNVTDFETKPK